MDVNNATPACVYHEIRRFEDARGAVVLMRVPYDSNGLELGAEHRRFLLEFAMQLEQGGNVQTRICRVETKAASLGEAFALFDGEVRAFVESERQKLSGQIMQASALPRGDNGRLLLDRFKRR